jgi:hypothetical protein
MKIEDAPMDRFEPAPHAGGPNWVCADFGAAPPGVPLLRQGYRHAFVMDASPQGLASFMLGPAERRTAYPPFGPPPIWDGATRYDLILAAHALRGPEEVDALAAFTTKALSMDGQCVLISRTEPMREALVARFVAACEPTLSLMLRRRTPDLRLDLLERA